MEILQNKVALKDIPTGAVFYLEGKILTPYLKTKNGYVDLITRTEETEKTADDCPCFIYSITSLTLSLHYHDIDEWVENAKKFYCPELFEDTSLPEENENTL